MCPYESVFTLCMQILLETRASQSSWNWSYNWEPWEQNPGSLQEHCVLLTTKVFPKAHVLNYNTLLVVIVTKCNSFYCLFSCIFVYGFFFLKSEAFFFFLNCRGNAIMVVEDSSGPKSSTNPTHYIVAPAWTPEPRTSSFLLTSFPC